MLLDVPYAGVHMIRQYPEFHIMCYQTLLRLDNSVFLTVPSLMHVQTPNALTYSGS